MDAQTAKSLLSFAETIGPTLRGPEAKALFGQFELRSHARGHVRQQAQ
ncbi:MAG TPA: hypothetical protein VFR47_05170 [Anaerolineales bacterium]|nr:hypothetical protein [Anaerolineales bacterium]